MNLYSITFTRQSWLLFLLFYISTGSVAPQMWMSVVQMCVRSSA